MPVTREKILELARSLPPAPRVFAELDGLLRDGNSGLDEIAALIKRDTSLVAQLLRVSNSVALGGEQKTASVEEAVARLGFKEVFHLVGEVAMGRLAERPLKYYGIDAEELREHMLHTAFICESLAVQCGLDARSAYTAGLMRPIGLLIVDRLAETYTDLAAYHPARDQDYMSWEGRTFGMPSCEVGAMVLSEWKFPSDLVEGVRNQYLMRSDDLAHRLACVLNLASGAVADDGKGLLGETQHWGNTPWKMESIGLSEVSFVVAVNRGRQAYADFRHKILGEAPDEPEVVVGSPSIEAALAVMKGEAPAPVMKPARVEAVSAAEAAKAKWIEENSAPVAPRGAPKVDSCNFPMKVRVVQGNDASPVHTTEAGLTPATDFTTFMRNYQDMVYSTAARLTGNPAQAEDISQEVFLKAYENYEQLSTSPTAGGWLKTVATNLSLNHLSRYRNRWRFFSEFKRDSDADDRDAPEVEFAAPDTFFSGVDAEDRRALVEKALEQLPEHQRVPLVLYHFEDMPYDEIAKKLRVSLAKVKTDILRARTALAKILSRSGTAHENALSASA